MEKSSLLHNIRVKLKNNEEYLIGYKTMTEAHNAAVRLEEDDRVVDIKVLTR